jgi:hypothetical protein
MVSIFTARADAHKRTSARVRSSTYAQRERDRRERLGQDQRATGERDRRLGLLG